MHAHIPRHPVLVDQVDDRGSARRLRHHHIVPPGHQLFNFLGVVEGRGRDRRLELLSYQGNT